MSGTEWKRSAWMRDAKAICERRSTMELQITKIISREQYKKA